MTTTAPLATTTALATQIAATVGAALTGSRSAHGELTITVPRETIIEVLTKLRDDPALQLESLVDICGVDFPARPERFEVVYHLLSLRRNLRTPPLQVAGVGTCAHLLSPSVQDAQERLHGMPNAEG